MSPGMSRGIRRQAVIILATLATAYVASHFFRAANVTIGLDLMRDLGIGPEARGALTGACFFGDGADESSTPVPEDVLPMVATAIARARIVRCC